MYDVIGLGELLIDFTPSGKSQQGNVLFEANPGGAPCNVLSMLSKCQKSTVFIGQVGDDMFGHQLKETVESVGIGTQGLKMSPLYNTTLAFVQIDETGDRNFSFYRNPGADMMLDEKDVDSDLFKMAKIFHFGTLSMTHDGVRKATQKAIHMAKSNQMLISFDPNLRPPLWESMELAIEQMRYGCSVCHILKIEDKELEILTGETGIEAGVKVLRDQYNIPLIFVTSGAEGSIAFYKDLRVKQAAFLTDKTVDTTGAGDTFCGSCLSFILDYGIDALNQEILEEMLTFASAAASIVTTRKGALKAMPRPDEVHEWIKNY